MKKPFYNTHLLHGRAVFFRRSTAPNFYMRSCIGVVLSLGLRVNKKSNKSPAGVINFSTPLEKLSKPSLKPDRFRLKGIG